MKQKWSLEFLLDWALTTGFSSKPIGVGSGITISTKNDRLPLCRLIVFQDIQDDCSLVFKINMAHRLAPSLYEQLQMKYNIFESEQQNQWPKIELAECSQDILNAISKWAELEKIEKVSPPPPPPPPPPQEKSLTTDNNIESILNIIKEAATSEVNHKSEDPKKKKSSTSNNINKWLVSFLSVRNGMTNPDANMPLYAYKTTDDEYRSLTKQLQLVVHFRGHKIFTKSDKFAALFILFAAEWWRRESTEGWTWAPLFRAIGMEQTSIDEMLSTLPVLLYPALEKGFKFWRRSIFKVGKNRSFIGSIAAEGGLPLSLLLDPGSNLQHYFKLVLERYLPVQTTEVSASLIAEELKEQLPVSFQRNSIYQLVGQIIETTLYLRSAYSLSGMEDPIAHLNKHYPEWHNEYPLSLDNKPAEILLKALVINAARSKEFSTAFSLIRFINTNFENQYELQAKIIFANKISIKALNAQFGEEEWPHQIELWLMRPIKTRIAMLSKINDEHYQVRSDGISWFDQTATAEISISFFSYGKPIKENQKLTDDSLMEDGLPWIFVEKNQHLSFLGQGGMKLATEQAFLLLPDNFILNVTEGEYEKLGSIEAIDRTLYKGSGSLVINCAEGFFSISTRQSKIDIEQYHLSGDRLYKQGNISQIFRGVPTLYKQSIEGNITPVSNLQIQWRYVNSSSQWQDWTHTIEGIIDIKVVQQGEILYRSRIAVLPENTDFKLTPAHDGLSGDLLITGLNNVRYGFEQTGIKVEDKQEPGDEEVRYCITRIDENLSNFMLDIQWPSQIQSLKIKMPLPIAGAKFHNAADHWLKERSFVSIAELAGIHAIGFNYTAGIPEQFYLDINIRANGITSKLQRALSRRIAIPYTGEKSELPLIQYREEFRDIIESNDDLDCSILCELSGKRVYSRISIARYINALYLDGDDVSIKSLQFGGHTQQSVIDSLILEIRSLLYPVEKKYYLSAHQSQGVLTGRWLLPDNLLPGPWLICSAKESKVSVRPAIYALEDYECKNDGRLRDAISVNNQKERTAAIDQCISSLITNYNHKDWSLVFETLTAFQHLPATTLDLWDRFAKNPDAMAMLLIRSEADNIPIVIDIARQLPFSWELVSFTGWMNALNCFSDFMYTNIPKHLLEMLLNSSLEEKLQTMVQADKILQTMTNVIGKHLISNNKESEQPINNMIETLKSKSNELLGHHGVDARWPVFQGQLLHNIEKIFPELTQELFLQQAHYMNAALNIPIALAINTCIPLSESVNECKKIDLFQLQQIRRFDENWYEEAFGISINILSAANLLHNSESF